MTQETTNKMESMPVPKLLITMAVPMMLSMLVQAVYAMVDSFFVARISDDALTGLTLAFPWQFMLNAVSTGFCIGINSVLSKSLGQKNYDKADKTAATGIKISFLNGIIFLIAVIFLSNMFISSQCNDEGSVEAGVTYLNIISGLSIFMFLEMMFERLLQATGRTNLSMYAMFAGAVFNCIFDPLLIFGIGPFPKMGVAGAAYATVLGQTLSMVIAIIFNLKKNKELHFTFKNLIAPKLEHAKEIFAIAIPASLSIGLGTLVTYGINSTLGRFNDIGPEAIALYGIYHKIRNFFFMPVFGLTGSLIPIISYNYGAKKPQRIKQTFNLSVLITAVLMITGALIFNIFPLQIVKIFTSSEKMLQYGKAAMQISAASFLFAGVSVTISSTFQAVGKSSWTLIVNIVRTIVILGAAYGLSKFQNLNIEWWFLTISETAAICTSGFFFFKFRKIISF